MTQERDWWDTEGETTGTSALGQNLYDGQGNLLGTLFQRGIGLSTELGGAGQTAIGIRAPDGRELPFQPGTYLLDAGMGKVWNVMLDAEGNITKSATTTLPTAPAPRAAPAYSSTRAGQDAVIAASWREQEASLKAQAAEAARNRDWETAERLESEAFQAGQNALALENQMKQTLIGEAGALQRTQLQLKGQARDLIAELYGRDYLRAAVRQGGQVARGTTPHMAFMEGLGATVDAPIQQVSSGMTVPQLEGAITTLQGNQVLPSPSPMALPGRAGGGPVAPGQAVRVHEGEVVANKGAGRVEVIPAGGWPIVANAAEGGDFDFDAQAIGQMMDRVYSHLGIPSGYTMRYMEPHRGGARTVGSPTAAAARRAISDARSPWLYGGQIPEIAGQPAWGLGGQPGALALAETMGWNPRLIRSSSERQLGQDPNQGMFWVDQDGVAHQMTPQQANAWGFNAEDFMYAHPSEIGSRYEIGNALAAAPPTQEREKGMFPLQPGPMRLPEELGSFAVMTPRTIANLYRNFTPTQRDILLSALEISGFGTEEDVLNEIAAFTPSGTAPQAVGFG